MTPSRSEARQCGCCGKMVPLSGFYVSNRTKCKACVKAAVKRRALTNPSVQEYDRARAKLPHRKAAARQVTISWRERHPEAYRAHTALNNAVRDGKVVREPCQVCGTTENVHGHHRDYSAPLDVTWLCAKCHHRLHALFPELAGHLQESATP